jgi:eukaryotic-like serine/threonine-protein kinase
MVDSEHRPEPDSLIGKTLNGRFEVVAPLGQGGMARVYQAIQHPLGRSVALKVLSAGYDTKRDPGFERRFFLEASLTSKLKHPNTVTIYDYGRTQEGVYFLAMEHLEGKTLRDILLNEKRLDWKRAFSMAIQVAGSLREAHRMGIVHRDLKPANIMLVDEPAPDTVKVLDFGLVKSIVSSSGDFNNPELTQSGTLLGSPLYLAPEQTRQQADARTDIYSLGVVLFECIAGRPPFRGASSMDIIIKHVREAAPALQTLVEGVPNEAATIVMKCLQKEPDQRFESMDALLDAMHSTVQGLGMSALFVDSRRATGSFPLDSISASQPLEVPLVDADESIEVELDSRRSRWPLVLGLSLVTVALFTLLGWFALRSPRSPSNASTPSASAAAVPITAAPTVPDNGGNAVVARPTAAAPKPQTPELVFELTSTPAGAAVKRDGAVLGITPFSVRQSNPTSDNVIVSFEFSLSGYETATVRGGGSLGVVPIRHTFVKQAPKVEPKKPKTAAPRKSTEYKDDPY